MYRYVVRRAVQHIPLPVFPVSTSVTQFRCNQETHPASTVAVLLSRQLVCCHSDWILSRANCHGNGTLNTLCGWTRLSEEQL